MPAERPFHINVISKLKLMTIALHRQKLSKSIEQNQVIDVGIISVRFHWKSPYSIIKQLYSVVAPEINVGTQMTRLFIFSLVAARNIAFYFHGNNSPQIVSGHKVRLPKKSPEFNYPVTRDNHLGLTGSALVRFRVLFNSSVSIIVHQKAIQPLIHGQKCTYD